MEKTKNPKGKISTGVKMLLLALSLAGAVLTIYSSSELFNAYARKTWHTAVATVLDSKVVGVGSIRPMVKYTYKVKNETYIDSSFLQAPGFGNKAKQYDVAMKLSRKYTKGNLVSVHYNPRNNSESVIITNPPWDMFVRIGVGVVLLILPLFFLFYPLLAKKKKFNRQH